MCVPMASRSDTDVKRCQIKGNKRQHHVCTKQKVFKRNKLHFTSSDPKIPMVELCNSIDTDRHTYTRKRESVNI